MELSLICRARYASLERLFRASCQLDDTRRVLAADHLVNLIFLQQCGACLNCR